MPSEFPDTLKQSLGLQSSEVLLRPMQCSRPLREHTSRRKTCPWRAVGLPRRMIFWGVTTQPRKHGTDFSRKSLRVLRDALGIEVVRIPAQAPIVPE